MLTLSLFCKQGWKRWRNKEVHLEWIKTLHYLFLHSTLPYLKHCLEGRNTGQGNASLFNHSNCSSSLLDFLHPYIQNNFKIKLLASTFISTLSFVVKCTCTQNNETVVCVWDRSLYFVTALLLSTQREAFSVVEESFSRKTLSLCTICECVPLVRNHQQIYTFFLLKEGNQWGWDRGRPLDQVFSSWNGNSFTWRWRGGSYA